MAALRISADAAADRPGIHAAPYRSLVAHADDAAHAAHGADVVVRRDGAEGTVIPAILDGPAAGTGNSSGIDLDPAQGAVHLIEANIAEVPAVPDRRAIGLACDTAHIASADTVDIDIARHGDVLHNGAARQLGEQPACVGILGICRYIQPLDGVALPVKRAAVAALPYGRPLTRPRAAFAPGIPAVFIEGAVVQYDVRRQHGAGIAVQLPPVGAVDDVPEHHQLLRISDLIGLLRGAAAAQAAAPPRHQDQIPHHRGGEVIRLPVQLPAQQLVSLAGRVGGTGDCLSPQHPPRPIGAAVHSQERDLALGAGLDGASAADAGQEHRALGVVAGVDGALVDDTGAAAAVPNGAAVGIHGSFIENAARAQQTSGRAVADGAALHGKYTPVIHVYGARVSGAVEGAGAAHDGAAVHGKSAAGVHHHAAGEGAAHGGDLSAGDDTSLDGEVAVRALRIAVIQLQIAAVPDPEHDVAAVAPEHVAVQVHGHVPADIQSTSRELHVRRQDHLAHLAVRQCGGQSLRRGDLAVSSAEEMRAVLPGHAVHDAVHHAHMSLGLDDQAVHRAAPQLQRAAGLHRDLAVPAAGDGDIGVTGDDKLAHPFPVNRGDAFRRLVDGQRLRDVLIDGQIASHVFPTGIRQHHRQTLLCVDVYRDGPIGQCQRSAVLLRD